MVLGIGWTINHIFSLFRRCIYVILSVGPIPNHIAFILDGNRRYAKKHKLREGAGHNIGFLSLTSMLQCCYELGVKHVTIYAFSIDNFKRRPEEIRYLMDLMQEKIEFLPKEENLVNRLGIRVQFFGNLKLLSEGARDSAQSAMSATATNSKAFLSICVAYTSTHEIVHAVEQVCKEKKQRKAWNEHVNLDDVERQMYLANIPEPDILVRTSGANRLSNFLLWQSAYAHLYSPSALWPEISFWHLIWMVLNYQRNYGYLEKQQQNMDHVNVFGRSNP
ncbi:Decaprenyl diphosphate synthase-like [Dillenia turbinata]|uniref:Alkyl transferase n=1 Tax=Dillenia turbinata TaxID=194707 RepID=A0AAN8Z112_9MAGN